MGESSHLAVVCHNCAVIRGRHDGRTADDRPAHRSRSRPASAPQSTVGHREPISTTPRSGSCATPSTSTRCWCSATSTCHRRATQQYLCGLLVGDRPPADRAAAEANAHLYSTRISNKDEDGNAPYGPLLFHADGMWSEHPQELLSLYGEKVELPSVPTLFVSAVRAWERAAGRPPGPHRRAHRGARHRPARPRAATRRRAARAATHGRAVTGDRRSRCSTPGRASPILYVSQMMTTHIEGLAPDESEQLLDELLRRALRPENTYEHDWRRAGSGRVGQPRHPARPRPVVTEQGPERSLRKVIAPTPS